MYNAPYIPQYPYQDNSNMYQQRLNDMVQQFSGQGQQNSFPNMNAQMPNMASTMGMAQMPAPQSQAFNIRAVSSFEEVVASQTPLDGSISIFTDFANGKIYTKQLNMQDGTALLKTYEKANNPTPKTTCVEKPVEYVEKSEFDSLKQRFEAICEALGATEVSKQKPKTESKHKEGEK